jgi:U6 snRNA-associated Sm-like protein LSm8
LRGLDQALNAFLVDCYERIFSADEGVKSVKIGVYLIRGENIMMIGIKISELF